ncbi:CHASE2 domain-containing protein [Planctomycetota bacterium]
MSKLRGRCWRGLLVGLVVGGATLGLWRLEWLASWEVVTWTWRARFFAQREVSSPQVQLILLDQAALDWGQEVNGWEWPWPREVYGAIAAFCTRGGARVLALDMLFTEPSVYGVADDEAMGEALRAGSPTVLAVMPGGSQQTWPSYVPRPPQSSVEATVEAAHLLFPVSDIVTPGATVGHVMGVPDADGVFRRVAPWGRFDGVDIPTLGLATWLANQEAVAVPKVQPGQLLFGNKVIPLDQQGQAILRFRGATDLSQAVSAGAVIQSELRLRANETPPLSPEIFKDCYVLLGCSAPGLMDLRPIPVNPKCPGVVLHATFIDNLLTDSFMAEVPVPVVVLGVLLTAMGAAISLSVGGRWWQAGPMGIVWLGLPLGIGFWAYAHGWWWPVATQETATALALVGAVAVNYSVEGRQKAFIKQAFRHYLSGEVIEKILHDPGHLQLGGEKRELTIMFTDLAGFSTFSERMEPVELTTLLNEYLTEMTDIIMEEGGTLDKYEGDAIIAFWNAPLTQTDHAMRACRAALRCQRRLAECRELYQQRFGATLTMRVGINTGEVVVGNMGSRKRFNYTILGDAANLAARLEGANKAFGTHTMVSENTWRLVSEAFQARRLANLRVMGRKNAVDVYELTGLASDTPPTAWKPFAAGQARFATGDFVAAQDIFEQLPDDPAAQSYVRRCEQLVSEPPTLWTGVWELSEK